MVSLGDIENFESSISMSDSQSDQTYRDMEQKEEILEKIENAVMSSLAERIHVNDDLLGHFSERGSEDSKNKYVKMFCSLFDPVEVSFLSDDLGESEKDVSTQISIGDISTTSKDGLGIRISYSVLSPNTTLPNVWILSAHGPNGPIGVGGVVLSEDSYLQTVRSMYKEEPGSVNNMIEHLKFVNMWKFIFHLECERQKIIEKRERARINKKLTDALEISEHNTW